MCKRTFARQPIPTFHETSQPDSEAKNERVLGAITAGGHLLAVILGSLFWKSFLPGYIHFSNDSPLSQQTATWLKVSNKPAFGTT